MAFNYISAAEAASLIKHGYNIGLSGFTPAGTAKAVTAELAKIAEAEHAKGNPFQIGIFTGASTGDSCDGILSRAKAIRYRAPYTTNVDFRKAVNNGEIAYNDIHLSQMAQEVRYGFMGKVNVAVIEACEVTPDGKIYLTAAGGIAPTICRLARPDHCRAERRPQQKRHGTARRLRTARSALSPRNPHLQAQRPHRTALYSG